ncbi:MAG: hypothetical protein CEE38_13900 [Planctomycetes bacterium B3_Pla]|nr:MAG: hypothetical protein CEE38_13900 [Planctomycetes bacterium B3_Pla]
MAFVDLQTKPCPFCAEMIQARAVKCRFCGEYLKSEKALALEAEAEAEAEANPDLQVQVPKDEHVPKDEQVPEDEEIDDSILFAGRPSLWGMTPTIVKGLFFLAVAGFLVKFPIEDFTHKLPNLELTEHHVLAIGQCRALAGFALGTIVVLIVSLRILKLKMVYYEISADRIELSRGVLNRRVDNIDMFRVIDLKMRRNLLDCIFGVGTVALETTDKTDPEFEFEKVRDCRYLYDVIKKASLAADRKTGVVHLE